MTLLKTIDAHVGGEPLRLVVEGFPAPRGKTMGEKRDWAARHADRLRRVLLLEPRGHADMCGAVLTEPTAPGSDAGVLFMDNEGFSAMCGHAAIAVATIALERRLIVPGGDGRALTFDTPAGTIRATVELTAMRGSPAAADDPLRAPRAERVAFVNVPSFVLHGGVDVTFGGRRLLADVAYGGAFYAIVDGESAGLPLDPAHLPELRRAGTEIRRAVNAMNVAEHPADARVSGIAGTIFTGPARDGSADLRNVTVFADGAVDRSACGTGTAAIMAVLDAMGLIDETREFVHESVLGTTLRARLTGRTEVAGVAAIVAEIQGTAWITGEHTFLVHPDDPMGDGFRLS